MRMHRQQRSTTGLGIALAVQLGYLAVRFRGRTREPLAGLVNDACLQTIPRAVNTGLGALFILAALFALGGDTLTDFALALLVGILVGTWSSVFVASPLLVAFERRSSRPPAAPASPRREPARPAAAAAAPSTPAGRARPAPSSPRAGAPRPKPRKQPARRGKGRRR